MKHWGSWTPDPTGDPADVHRNTYRIFCVLAGVLNPTFGIVYRYTNPDAIDPLWARFGLAVIALLLVSLSFMHERIQKHLITLVQSYFYLLIVYIVGLTAVNDFLPNYTLGLMFTITAVGVAFSLGLKKRMGPLVRYLAFAVLLTVPAALWAAPPQVSMIILWICAFSTAVVIYVAADAKTKAEASMEASEQRYHILMDAASDAIFIADPSTGKLIDANRKAQELIGRSLDEIQRLHVMELFPADGRQHYCTIFEAHVYEKRSIEEDLFVCHASGECIPIDVNASLIDVGGRKLIQGIFRRHRYEQQLIQAKERAEELLHLKSSLLNNMSHELRTPLTSILGYAEMMAEGQRPEECADVIITSAKRLQDTLNSILSLAQLESGDASLDLKRVNLADAIVESVALLKPLADKKRIALKTTVLTDDACALADEICLSRIVNNLVGNAIKFTEQGYVKVEVEGDADTVSIRVSDSGIGISETFFPNLFKEFRQESSGLARTYEGTGLGLAITKRLVELLQGTIAVSSTKGAGSTFTVTLPRAAPGRQQEDFGATAPMGDGASRLRVLVVEDNAETCNLIVQRLETLVEVAAASDPTTALRMARESHFDAFFLDINLGSLQDGIDVLGALRGMAPYAHTPMVALTAYAMPSDRSRFLDAGFDHYLSKPFTREQFFELVYRILTPQPFAGDGGEPNPGNGFRFGHSA